MLSLVKLWRNKLSSASLLITVVLAYALIFPAAGALLLAGTLVLEGGENALYSSVIDAANGFAYFGTGTTPGIIVKIRLSDLSRVGALTLGPGEGPLTVAIIDGINGFGYFGTGTSPGKIVKVRLSDLTRLTALTLQVGEGPLSSAVIDFGNGYAYFGTFTGVLGNNFVVKVRLSDLSRVAALNLKGAGVPSAAVDSGNGFGYFLNYTQPGSIVKVRLSDFTIVGSLLTSIGCCLSQYQLVPETIVIDAGNGFAYVGAFTFGGRALLNPAYVLKVRLSDMSLVGWLEISGIHNSESCLCNGLSSAVIDASAGIAYFGTQVMPIFDAGGNLLGYEPAGIVGVSLRTFTVDGFFNLSLGNGNPRTAVIDSGNGFAYWGTDTTPGEVLRMVTDLPAIPEYPFGLALAFLAVVLVYALVRRRLSISS